MRFSTKLSALFFVIILLTGAGISYFVYTSNVKTLGTHIEDRLKNQAFHTMDKIDMMLFERYEDIKVLSSDPVISSRSATIEQLTQRLIEFKNSRGYDSLAFYDLNKKCIADTSGNNLGKKHLPPEIWQGLEEGRDIFMAVVKSDFLNRVILRFSSVVKDKKGTRIGFIVSRVPIESLYGIVKQAVGIYNVEKDFEVELINKDGLLLYSMDPEDILKEESVDWDAIKNLRSKGLTMGALKFTNPKEKTGEELLVFASEKGHRGFKGNDWILKLEVPTKVAFASAVKMRNRILVISLFISLFAFIIARLISSRISKPIERLSAASEEVAKGNLDIKVDVTAADETGKLAEAFNRMTTDLKEQRDKLLSYSSELEKEKIYLENLHNSIGDAVFSVKIPERVIEFANRSVESIFRYKPEEMLGQKTVGFYPDEKGYLDFGKKLNEAIEKGENILHTEHMLKRKNGEIFPADITVTFLMENSENTKVVSIIRDITERKKAKEALQKALIMAEAANLAKSEFLANMSHELRTPLNHIIGFSEMLREGMAGPLTNKQKEYTGDIAESGNRLLSLLNDVLELSRIEIGGTEPDLKVLDIRPLLEDNLALFKEKASRHNISATIDLGEDIATVTADGRCMKQIIVSLLSNAFKFTPDGGSVRLSARKVNSEQLIVNSKKLFTDVYSLTTDGDFIEISVEDTGPGIAEEDLEKLFVPFKQLEPVFTKRHGGAGVGLYLTKRLVEMHNGRIWVESEKGKGSQFIFVIPVGQRQTII